MSHLSEGEPFPPHTDLSRIVPGGFLGASCVNKGGYHVSWPPGLTPVISYEKPTVTRGLADIDLNLDKSLRVGQVPFWYPT